MPKKREIARKRGRLPEKEGDCLKKGEIARKRGRLPEKEARLPKKRGRCADNYMIELFGNYGQKKREKKKEVSDHKRDRGRLPLKDRSANVSRPAQVGSVYGYTML